MEYYKSLNVVPFFAKVDIHGNNELHDIALNCYNLLV